MIASEPKWHYRREAGLTQHYGHVDTYDDAVLGQWFCLDAESGAVRWERDMTCPNAVTDVADGVIVCSEFVIQGPSSYSRGVYGLSLDTGEQVWQADPPHPTGGTIARFFHRIGLLVGSDSPALVEHGMVHCTSGRILSVVDGSELKAHGAKTHKDRERTRVEKFYYDEVIPLKMHEGRFISAKRPGGAPPNLTDEGTRFYGVNSNRVDDWKFSLSEHGYSAHTNYYSHRLVGDFVYVLGKEGEFYEETSEKFVVRNREAPCHLLTVDALTGETVQDITLPEPAHEYRIESVSSNGLLLSHSNT